MFEVLGSDPTTAVATVHSAATGAHTAIASAVATGDLSEGFHTFGVNAAIFPLLDHTRQIRSRIPNMTS